MYNKREISPNLFKSLICSFIVTINQAAMAQPLANCVKELVSVGVSPNVAADKCLAGRASDPSSIDQRFEKYEKCIEKNRYSTLKGLPKARQDGKTEYEYSLVYLPSALDSPQKIAATGATCWTHGFFPPKLLCWDSEIKYETRSLDAVSSECRALIPESSNSGKSTIIINQSGR